MSDVKTFLLPDVGEGLTEAEVIAWHVKPGDVVTVNQAIVEIETAKAAVELPCPFAGTIAEVLVAEGDVVPVGTPILRIATADREAAGPSGGDEATAAVSAPASPESGDKRDAVLVGYGVKQTGAPQRRPRVPQVTPHGAPAPEAGPPGESARPTRYGSLEVGRRTEELLSRRSPVLAKPPIRKLAKDLGVDLGSVDATGEDGTVTRSDVERAATLAGHGARAMSSPSTGGAIAPTWTGPREERTPVRGVRRTMAEAMVASAFTAPHVTEWVDVDVTRAVDLLARLKDRPVLDGVRVGPLLLVAAAVVRAARRFPGVNSTFDAEAGEVVTKHYVNLGVAADTPRGLVVPNIKDADRLDLVGLARALHDLVETARAGKAQPAELLGGTITITNVGVFGVDGGTPIINPGESAILAMGRVLQRPWVVDGQVVPRHVMQLTLSFDHRHVDGALGSQFLADVAAFLEDPAVALLLP